MRAFDFVKQRSLQGKIQANVWEWNARAKDRPLQWPTPVPGAVVFDRIWR
jgi:hypothetical protein